MDAGIAQPVPLPFLNLNGENVTKLSEKIKTKGKWRLEGDSNSIWEEMIEYIRRSAWEVVRVSKKEVGG